MLEKRAIGEQACEGLDWAHWGAPPGPKNSTKKRTFVEIIIQKHTHPPRGGLKLPTPGAQYVTETASGLGAPFLCSCAIVVFFRIWVARFGKMFRPKRPPLKFPYFSPGPTQQGWGPSCPHVFLNIAVGGRGIFPQHCCRGVGSGGVRTGLDETFFRTVGSNPQ